MIDSIQGIWSWVESAGSLRMMEIEEKQKDAAKFTPQAYRGDGDKKEKRIQSLIAERASKIGLHGRGAPFLSAANAVLIGMDTTDEECLSYMMQLNAMLPRPFTAKEVQHKVDDAPTLGGIRGYLLNTERQRPLSAEEQFAHDAVFKLQRGRNIWRYGPGWTCELIEVLPVEPAAPPDLSDIANFPAGNDSGAFRKPYVHVPPEPTFCPHLTTMLHHDKMTREAYEQDHCCKAIRCPFCFPLVQSHWKASFHYHLIEQHDKDGGTEKEPLWTFHCAAGDWERVYKCLDRADASYMRIDPTNDGRTYGPPAVIVSTHRVKGIEAAPITPQAAYDFLCRLVDQLPDTSRKGCFTHSQDWGALKDEEKKPSRFECLGRLDSSPEARDRVRTERGITGKHISGKGRFYPRRGIIYSYGQRDWEHLREEIRFGETIFEGTIKWGKAAAADPDDGFDQAPEPPRESIFAGGLDLSGL